MERLLTDTHLGIAHEVFPLWFKFAQLVLVEERLMVGLVRKAHLRILLETWLHFAECQLRDLLGLLRGEHG